MKKEALSPRQLSVAVLTGGMSAAAAAAGQADWRWLLAAGALGVLLGWLLLRRVGGRALHPVLRWLYAGWAVVLMAETLGRSAERLHQGAGAVGGAGWLMVLLALPLLWMGWGGGTAFFRAVEIFWLAALAATAAILLLGLPRVDWRWVLEPGGGWEESLAGAAGILSAGLFTLPQLYNVKEERGGIRRGLVWLGALACVSAALSTLTAGLLSPAVAAQVEGPFFVAAGLLGDSARLEGLVSALWLLPDLTLAGLLSRSWGERRWPALGAALALALALTGAAEGLPVWTPALGTAALAALTAAFPPGGKK